MSFELPDGFPEHLRSLALPPRDDEPDGPCWTADDALFVVEQLVGSGIAVSAGRVYRRRPWGVEPTADDWSCERLPGEGGADYDERCRVAAIGYIQTYTEDHGGRVCFLLRFVSFAGDRPEDALNRNRAATRNPEDRG